MKYYSTIRYTLAGLSGGLLFLFVAWGLAIHSSGLPLSPSSIIDIHEINEVIFLVDTVPVALAFIFFFMARTYSLHRKELHLRPEQLATAYLVENYEAIVETMTDGFVTIDEEEKILSFNPAAEKILGYSEKEILGKKISTLLPDFPFLEKRLFIDNLDTDGRKNLSGKPGREIVGESKDGNIFTLSITVSEIYVRGKRLFSGVMRDITNVENARTEALRVAKELTQLVDTANVPIFGIDSEGLVNEWNQTAEKITGFTKAEALGKDPLAEFITDEYKASMKKVLDSALNGQEVANYEFPLYTKGGQRVDVLLNVTTRRDVDGVITGVIGVGQDITQSKQVQAEAIRVAEELTLFVDTANAPIFGIDSKGLVNEWNQTAEKITGFAKAEVLGKDLVAEFITDEYKVSVKRVLDNALNAQESANYEFPMYTKDGQRVDVLLNATTRRDVDGVITGVIGVGQDITQSKQVQAEAIRVAEELTLFVDTANAPIFGIDSKGLVNEWNQTAEKITDFTKAEVLGKDLVAEFITDEYKVSVKRVLDNALNAQESANYEFPMYTKDGQRVDVLLNATTRRDVDGVITGVIGVGQDITQSKQAQAEALRVAEELTQFVDTANAPIFGIDSKGLVNEWNQTAEKITEFTKKEVLGKDLVAEFITDDYKEPVKKVLDNALNGQETANYEFPMYTKDGQRIDVLLNATTRRDVDGVITGVIGVGQDITELRNKERALNQSRKMETIGQLTGGIAHDFNNLLSIIGGNLRFLKQDMGEVSKEVDELFEDAMSATKDGADLTARLLAFSRNRVLKPEVKEVNETIESFSRFISRTLGEAIDVETDLSKEQFYINVDASQLENALLNLAINARDAMPDGGRITIRAERYQSTPDPDDRSRHGGGEIMLAAGNYILVTVEDTGTGINENDLLRIYEPFFTTKDVGKGSGLGLSMVYGFVQQSNGQCHVRSNLGEGTEMLMYFPEAANIEKLSHGERNVEIDLGRSETILVVEDEPRVRRVTVRDLHNLGYQTLEAENAKMAKEILNSEKKIDLVFSDVLMPGEIDGQMLGLWVKKNHPQIKVVLTSGFTKRKTEVEESETRFPLIRKPYTREALAKLLKTMILEGS